MIREGMAADIVVFSEADVADQSTFSKPHSYSIGFKHVVVNGKLVIEDSRHTSARSGMVLHGPGFIDKDQ
jgi:N-acyl-D-amino-acid deacylase